MSATPEPDMNLQRGIDRVREAAARGAQIVCLPELFQTQYFCQREDAALFDLAEPLPGPTTAKLSELAKQLRIVLIASLFEKRAAGLYHNTAAVFDADGSLRGLYRKMHIPDDPLYYEKFYFTPGDLGFRAWPTPYGRIGTLVCWDQWYPEAARLTALQGAEIIFYPTAIGWHPAEKAKHGAAQPAEWERHEATWLSWPRRDGISFPGRYDAVPALWGAMIAALSAGELVRVNVADAAQEQEVRALLTTIASVRRDRVLLHRIPSDE